ncbi:MAG: DNA replication and repair protein RecF [Armatimonadetes bacterium]|nr:DNA replication and repair protein RecF [Armatimonadota bacterium]
MGFGLSHLRLENYRNYEHLDLELAPGFNVFYGRNAQGKTNLLESIALLSTTRILRGKKDHEVVRSGAEFAFVEGELLDGAHISISVPLSGRKRAALNRNHLPRAADLLGRLPSVCITTEDLAFVRGEPADRRLALDLALSALYPSYLRDLTIYKRAVEQRNALLKERDYMPSAAEMEPWEIEIAQHGSSLRNARLQYLKDLQPIAAAAHEEIGRNEHLSMNYAPCDASTSAEELLRALEGARRADLARGGTSVGPHRDDVVLLIDGKEVRLFGSQGQQRTTLIAYQIGSMEVASNVLGDPPILLLDDMLSDLDATRRKLLSEAVSRRASQALLTCTELEAVGDAIGKVAVAFEVEAGKLVRRN